MTGHLTGSMKKGFFRLPTFRQSCVKWMATKDVKITHNLGVGRQREAGAVAPHAKIALGLLAGLVADAMRNPLARPHPAITIVVDRADRVTLEHGHSAYSANARYTDARPILSALAMADAPLPSAFICLTFTGSMLALRPL